jgi:nitroreductase
MDESAHRFNEEQRRGLYRAIYERRDVRSFFKPDEIPDDVLARLLDAAHHAPSVGFMQPWSFIIIRWEHRARLEGLLHFERYGATDEGRAAELLLFLNSKSDVEDK